MAAGGQFYWPPAGIFVAAYGQFFMAANTSPRSYCEGIYGGAGAMPVWPPLSQIKPFRQDGTAYWALRGSW